MTTETKRDSLQRPKGRGFSHASIMNMNDEGIINTAIINAEDGDPIHIAREAIKLSKRQARLAAYREPKGGKP